MRRGCIRVRSVGDRDLTFDVACDRCGDDDPLTEKERPTATKLQWLCCDCADADREAIRAHVAPPPTGPELAERYGFEPLASSGAERVQGVDGKSGDERTIDDLRADSVLAAGEACIQWCIDTGDCHLCGFLCGAGSSVETPHDEDCPLAEYWDELMKLKAAGTTRGEGG